MQDTFFVPSFGNRPKQLVGRDQVLEQFEQCLRSVPGSRERAVLLLGQRGFGKTVLLLEFAEMAREAGYIVASPTIVSEELTDRIIEKLLIELGNKKPRENKKLIGGSISVMGFGGGVQFHDQDVSMSFEQRLNDICKAANQTGHPVLILVDETRSDSRSMRRLASAYQEMVGQGRNIAIALAGLPSAISSVLNDHVLTFLNRSTKIELASLHDGDIITYYQSAFRELNISMQADMIREAARASAGAPYLMQLIGHYIIDQSKAGESITKDSLEQAVSIAKKDFVDDVCKTTLAALSERDLDFLTAMAQLGDSVDIRQLVQTLGVSDAYTQLYKRRLVQAGVIDQPKRGKVRFAVPYLREYLVEERLGE